MGFNSGLNVTSTRRTLSACNPTKVKIHKIQFCFTASATFFVNCSCLVQKWMLQFGCRLHWWWRQAHFGVQTWPEISLKMSHFKQRLHQVFSGRINPLCVLLQSRTEPYCWKPFTFLYLKQARQSSSEFAMDLLEMRLPRYLWLHGRTTRQPMSARLHNIP